MNAARRWLATAAIVACVSSALGVAACQRRGEGTPGNPRVVVLGFDGIDGRRFERLVNEGRLPNLASLRDRGGVKPLYAVEVSPTAWRTVATGDDVGTTRARTSWAWAGDAGVRSVVLDSDVSEELLGVLTKSVGPPARVADDVGGRSDEELLQQVADALDWRRRAVLNRIDQRDAELVVAVFGETADIAARFACEDPDELIDEAYRAMDRVVGDVLRHLPERTKLLVVAPTAAPRCETAAAADGVAHGIVVSRTPMRSGEIAPIDVAPSVLSWLDAPIPPRMLGKPVARAR